MSTTQPEALRLADWLEDQVVIYQQFSEGEPGGYAQEVDQVMDEAAAELRRLHAYAAELESQVIADCMAGGASGVSPLMGAAGDAAPVVAQETLAEIALIEKAVQRVGIKSLLNHGAGSLVYSEGVQGVTQSDLVAYTREIALHCAVALAADPSSAKGVAHG